MDKVKISRHSFLLALSSVFFCACATPDTEGVGGVVADSSTASEATAIDPSEVTGELCIYLERSYADDLTNPAIWQRVKAFQEEYPNITLTFESPVGGMSDYESREADITRIETEIIAGGGPDMFLFGYNDYTDCKLFPDLDKAMQNGAFLDCSASLLAFDTDVTSDDFWQVVMETGRIGDAQYFIPLSFDFAIAVGAQTTIDASGFAVSTAQQSTADFVAEIEQVYQQNNRYTTYFTANSISNLATAVMDYDANTIRLEETQVELMFLLEQEIVGAAWNQGRDNLLQELTQTGEEHFYNQEAARLANGERLLYVSDISNAMQLLWVMSANDTAAMISNLPNEYGSGTAVVNSCVSINANTKNEVAASLFIAYLLGEKSQDNAAYPSALCTLPVRVNSLANAIDSYQNYQNNIWWCDPSEEQIALWEEAIGQTYVRASVEEIAAWKLQYGTALTEDMVADLRTACENITAASLETIFSKTIQSEIGDDADSVIYAAYNQFIEGELSYSELQSTLTQRLQLYLDE